MRVQLFNRQVLTILGLLIIPSIIATTVTSGPKDNASTASLSPREDDDVDEKRYLHGEGGPSIKDVMQSSNWFSHWLNAVLGSLAWTNPKLLASLWGADTIEGGSREWIDKQTFYLYDQMGVKQGIDIFLANINWRPDRPSNNRWWQPGIQSSVMQLGGILGADKDSIGWGSPVDAFRMLVNKTAVIEQVTDEKKFWGYVEKAEKMPVLFGTGADPSDKFFDPPWQWYIVQKAQKDPNGENNKFEVWDAYFGETETLELSKVFKDIRKVVYCEECQVES